MSAAAPRSHDPRVDAYIASAAEFARPVLARLRELVHHGCPEVTETIKWGMPSFEYRGILCGMGAFKQHCVFGFWKHKLLFPAPSASGAASGTKARPTRKPARDGARRDTPKSDQAKLAPKDGAMGEFGRITCLADLPSKAVILDLVRRAARLNDEGVQAPRVAKPKQRLVVPKDLAAALHDHPAAARTFEAFSYSKRKDYITWLTEAKSQATRDRRLATTLVWLAAGKSRNWKYEHC